MNDLDLCLEVVYQGRVTLAIEYLGNR